jgi:ankyrin repeat protein
MYSTALQVAAYHGHEEIVRTLIANGADVRLKGGDCDTALQAAAFRGNEKIVDILFDCHADLGSEGGRFGTALVAAASSGHGSIVSKLLNANISIHTINFKSKYRSTALEAAALKGYQRIVEELLQVGADHGSAIMEAAQRDHEEVVQIFTSTVQNSTFHTQSMRAYTWIDMNHFSPLGDRIIQSPKTLCRYLNW